MNPVMYAITFTGSLDHLALDMAKRLARADDTTPWAALPYSDQAHYLNQARIACGALVEDEFELAELPFGGADCG